MKPVSVVNVFSSEKAGIGIARELRSRIKVNWQACVKNMLIALIIYLSILLGVFLPVSLQKWVFSVLVIWTEKDEQVGCGCAFEEKGVTEVWYKVKPWNGDLSSQYSAISYY